MGKTKVNYIRLKSTERASWYLAGFGNKEVLFLGMGFVYTKLGDRYGKVFEDEPCGVKPALTKQFLDMQPGLNGYTSTDWMTYLNTKEKSPFAGDALGSLRSALDLFRKRYGYNAGVQRGKGVAKS
ncbi:hypothetical protein [Rufibacter aurantiacus]|uniref:hypothetical protein n=1 Tax=Rufibacter aurantiacus TaxID=2817374 RepID=UPI001B30347F|nr:hypothetical protein [Rufibacter aurantiacus]